MPNDKSPTKCDDCGKSITPMGVAAGFALMPRGDHVTYLCYKCTANHEKETMRSTGKIDLYLVGDGKAQPFKVSDFSGHLTFKPTRVSVGKHNVASKRWDVWFRFENETWHGVCYGNSTQVLHCKRIKG